MSSPKVWVITGCSSGFGTELTLAALARGDKVIATGRNVAKLDHLRAAGAATLSLDINAGDEYVQTVIDEALQVYGTIDILVNNAGYAIIGGIEECSDEEVKAQFETNFFAQLRVLRAVLPHMRSRESGVIANMGSIGGWTSSAGAGVYCATKFALVGITEALRAEVANLGIEATIIEPGYFRTSFLGKGSKVTAAKTINDLRPVLGPLKEFYADHDTKQPGDPVKASQLLVEALTKSGRCEGRGIPLRLLIGSDAARLAEDILERERKSLGEWTDLITTTDHDDVAPQKQA